jgi:hypothetical protein
MELTALRQFYSAATLDKYISAQQQASELADWASTISGEISTRIAEQRKAQYLRWARVLESLRNDFQRCAAKITEAGFEVQFRDANGLKLAQQFIEQVILRRL